MQWLTRVALGLVVQAVVRASASSADIVATYEGGEIAADDVRDYSRLHSYAVQDPWKSYLSSTDEEDKNNALYFVEESVKGILFARIVGTEEWNGSASENRSTGFVFEDRFRSCLKDEWTASVRDNVTTMTLAQAEKLVAKDSSKFNIEESRTVEYIFRKDVSEESRSLLEHLKSEIESGTTLFESAAREHSQADSRRSGGYVGKVSRRGKLKQDFVDLVYSTPVGGLGGPAELSNGMYLINVVSATDARTITASDALRDSSLSAELLENERDRTVAERVSELRTRYATTTLDDQDLSGLIIASGFRSVPCERLRDLAKIDERAHSRFIAENSSAFEPTDGEMKNFYKRNISLFLREGGMRLSRFEVRISTGRGSVVSSKAEALVVARSLRDLAASGHDEALKDPRLESLVSESWVMGSDWGPADDELFAMKMPGGYTSAFANDEAAFFFRLDARREPRPESFETNRGRIRQFVYNEKVWKTRAEMIRSIAERVRLRRSYEPLGAN